MAGTHRDPATLTRIGINPADFPRTVRCSATSRHSPFRTFCPQSPTPAMPVLGGIRMPAYPENPDTGHTAAHSVLLAGNQCFTKHRKQYNHQSSQCGARSFSKVAVTGGESSQCGHISSIACIRLSGKSDNKLSGSDADSGF